MKKITLPLIACAELLVAAGACAQSPTNTADTGGKIEEVTVTGSQIRGHENPGGQVYSLTSEDIKVQGFTTTDDIFRSIPQVSGRGSMAAMDVNEQVPSGSVGHSSVDLGGFGAKSTLVLINGRRTASSSIMYGDSVNVSTIPVSAIERIEILPTAAAAIYGADAVGGVVNIILKKRTQLEANTQVGYEDSSSGGDASQVSQDLSFGWDSGRFTGVASYRKSDPVTSRKLGFTTQDFRSRGGYDLRSQTFGETGSIIGFGSLPATNNGTAFAPSNVSTANIVPASSIAEYVVPELKTTSAYINVEQNVSGNVTLFLDAFYSKNDTDNYETPFQLYGVEVPATNAFNPYGKSVFVNYQFDTERDAGRIPSVYREADQELMQGTFGAMVTLPRDWRLQVYGTRANEDSFHTYSQIASWSDPAVIAALADSNPQTALNVFGNGTVQNQATLDRLVSLWMGKRHNKIESTLTAYALQADGELFELPAGAVKASFSAERRKDTLEWAGFGTNQPEGDRTADALGSEFAIPLLSAADASGQALELTLAARWDRYNADGDFDHDGTRDKMKEFSDVSPMVGLSWKPFASLRLRGSWNKAFRAPVVHDLAGASYDYQTEVFDPLAPGGPALVPVGVSYAPSPDLGPEKAKIWSAGADWEWLDASGAGLKASLTYNHTQFSDRITGVYIYFNDDPSFVVSHPELFGGAVLRDASGNLTKVLLRNINIAGQTAQSWNTELSYGWRSNGHYFTLGASGVYTAKFEERVYDGGTVEELQGTYRGVDRLRATVRGGWSSPEGNWGANVFVHTSSSYTNVIPSYAIHNPPAGTGSEIKEKVDGYTTVDLSGSYQYRGDSALLDGVLLTAGVRNLFDEDFPLIDLVAGRTQPFDPRRVDVRGRVGFVEIKKQF